MLIPKAFTVGPSRYEVRQVRTIDKPPSHGRLFVLEGRVDLASHNVFDMRYLRTAREETFWHEVLHTCLLDMGKPLEKHDENFLDALAKRITQVCNTAEV